MSDKLNKLSLNCFDVDPNYINSKSESKKSEKLLEIDNKRNNVRKRNKVRKRNEANLNNRGNTIIYDNKIKF